MRGYIPSFSPKSGAISVILKWPLIHLRLRGPRATLNRSAKTESNWHYNRGEVFDSLRPRLPCEVQMSPIDWNDRLSVKVAELDQQHKTLLATLAALNEAMSIGKGNVVLERIVTDLVAYTATHFQTEENYFAQFGYSDADKHKREHAYFAKKVADFKREIARGNAGMPAEIVHFLSDWLKQHIMGSDKRYSQLFKERGLK
jgi:hemerythrin